MADDGSTRKTKAVRRRGATPVAEQATRPVKAVKRRPKAVARLGLLPEEALGARSYRFLETKGPWGLQSDFTTNRYEVQLEDRTPVLQTPRRFSLVPGWHFEVRDLAGALRFALSLGLQKLVMRKVRVLSPGGEELGRIEQRFSMMDVKFDVLDPDGSLRFRLFQPADRYTVYELYDGDFRVARISKDRAPPVKSLGELLRFDDAFRVDLESSTLDERDRVLAISAALFMDRVFHTEKD